MVAAGRVDPRKVRLWMRSPGGGPHRVEVWRADGSAPPQSGRIVMTGREDFDDTLGFVYPDDCEGALPLEPLTRYRFRITKEEGGVVGEGGFETAPEVAAQMPRKFCIGVASCHQPFEEDGTVRERGLKMLEAARSVWKRHDVKFVLWVGDQLYSDFPEHRSMFIPEVFKEMASCDHESIEECSRQEVADLYHARYRLNWGMPEWQALQAEFPGYPILDDHEVRDNFGSLPEHHAKRFQNIRAGAGAAYRDYQHSRVEPDPALEQGPYCYGVDYGTVGVYVLDIRSKRRSKEHEGRVFVDGQLNRLALWLEAHRTCPAIFLVVGVPVFFMPEWASSLAGRIPSQFREDSHDRWMHPKYREDRRRLLELIRAHQLENPDQKVVMVSGDVHVGYAVRCDWRKKNGPVLYQFVSSPITHEMSDWNWRFARHVPRTHFVLPGVGDKLARIHLMGGLTARFRQPIAGLNVGVIEVDLSDGDGDRAHLEYKIYGETGECLFTTRCE